MVSALWNASADGDVPALRELLKDATPTDIEIRDTSGATPLYQAVVHGHVEAVKLLLEKGADANSAIGEGGVGQLTNDPVLVELLSAASAKGLAPSENVYAGYTQPNGFDPDAAADTSKTYYSPVPNPYMYYPAMPAGTPMMPEGGIPYYPPPPSSLQSPVDPSNGTNLPPPEVARMIPCRYFPACRYGPSCMFAHPQAPYYPPGPVQSPAPYPIPYESMASSPYPSGYYAMSPTGYPNGTASPISPQPPAHHTPTPPISHTRAASEIVSPVHAPFTPSVPAPASYPIPVSMSPTYSPAPHPSMRPGFTPMSPPIGQPVPNPQSPTVAYPPVSAVTQGGPQIKQHRRDSSAANAHVIPPPATGGEVAAFPQSPPLLPQGDQPTPFNGQLHRDGPGHLRRGSIRRGPSGIGRNKPPCLFFPSGRCRNGDDCRFPHVAIDAAHGNGGPHFPTKYSARGRPHNTSAGHGSLEEKMATMNVKDNSLMNGDVHSAPNGRPNGGLKLHPNGVRDVRRPSTRQRIPTADEFPVLAGSATPPPRSPGPNGPSGPTAAQVLQAPAPVRRESHKTSVSGSDDSEPVHRSPVPSKSEVTAMTEQNGSLVNGIHDSLPEKVREITTSKESLPTVPDAGNVQVAAAA